MNTNSSGQRVKRTRECRQEVLCKPRTKTTQRAPTPVLVGPFPPDNHFHLASVYTAGVVRHFQNGNLLSVVNREEQLWA